MIFNSPEFLFLFLPLSLFLYFFLLHKRLVLGAKAVLVFASLFFYGWWEISYLPLILSSMIFNYAIGHYLNKKIKDVDGHKKLLLILGIIANIGLLGYFKYTNFLILNLNLFFEGTIPTLNLILPLAISFFTFQQIAYLVDSYRGETNEYDLLNYSLFVTFFPQLIAGPIVHHAEMMPQFASKRNWVKNYSNIATGLFIFSIGLFKKIVIADTFASWATIGFDEAPVLNLFEAWATSLSYTFQLYFDFSGYTDMAIGAALLFNIKLPLNFNSPYKALDIQDFWRRWHITLSRFLRDYIYIPLGGNRKGLFRTYSNILATFILGGLWHGAGWTFIFWGFLHGFSLVIFHIWKKVGGRLPKVIAWFITFNFINISWVFFRAKDWESAIKIIEGMVGLTGIIITKKREKILYFLSDLKGVSFGDVTQHIGGGSDLLKSILMAFFIVLYFKNSFEIVQKKEFKFYQAVFIAFTILLSYLMSIEVEESPFLYFNF
ncbi:MAG: MBOAT family protein [Methylococcales bacterium]|nr:MBOAT family protein [Methylococcales bacterium]